MDFQKRDSLTELDEPAQNTEEKAAMKEAVANAKAKKELEREEKQRAHEEQLRRHLETVQAARESNVAHAAKPSLEPIEIIDISTSEPDKSLRNTCLNHLRNVLYKRRVYLVRVAHSNVVFYLLTESTFYQLMIRSLMCCHG